MLLRKIKWNNHPILGDLLLDLSNGDSAYKTIILAGENGTGKSTILEHLSSFLNSQEFSHFEYIEYIVDSQILRVVAPENQENPEYNNNYFDIKKNEEILNSYPIFIREETIDQDPRHYGCIYSKARADYKTERITSTSTSLLDVNKYAIDSDDNFTSLKQLIVDISSQDAEEFKTIHEECAEKGETPVSINDFQTTSKLYRFKNAFNNFFEELQFSKVINRDNEKVILFKKHSNQISIDNLSTGEKQVVFRGSYLLKNSQILHGATILIDEPELSMHPKWQKKILTYYKELFTSDEQQIAQLFFATHSDHVVQAALQDNETAIITLKRSQGLLTSFINNSSISPVATAAEINYKTFDLPTIDYHIELFGKLQADNQINTIKACDEYVESHSMYVSAVHQRPSRHNTTHYHSLTTYIRNAIHHPDSGNTFTEQDLRTSIELLENLTSNS